MRKSKPPPDSPKDSSDFSTRAATLPKLSSVPRMPAAGVPTINGEEEDNAQTTATRTFSLGDVDEGTPETLTVIRGPDEGRVFPIHPGEVWIGRGQDCDVVIRDTGLSRRHASLIVTDGGVTLRDNQAKNGTFVDGVRVDERILRPGDEVQLGANVSLLFSRTRGLAGAMERESADSVASIVAGLAHEINTPLGVANTANALIQALTEEVQRNPNGERIQELLSDLRASAGLVSKNLERTNELVRLFKQLSSREAFDERSACDLRQIATECIDALRPEIERRKITVRIGWAEDSDFMWVGFYASMSKVLGHLIRNTLRYGYPNQATGHVDVRLSAPFDKYRVEVEDYGIGVAPHILSRLFQPFVTSGRETGATGLGLAVVRNIVTNLFGGTVRCTSRVGKGTRFVITIPRVAPSSPVSES